MKTKENRKNRERERERAQENPKTSKDDARKGLQLIKEMKQRKEEMEEY